MPETGAACTWRFRQVCFFAIAERAPARHPRSPCLRSSESGRRTQKAGTAPSAVPIDFI